MSLESGALGAIVAKIGWLKVLSLGSALVGAVIMAVFRPPQSRKEMALQAAVALGTSFLFGDLAFQLVDGWLHVGQAGYVPVHGLLGAMSWGIFGGLAHYRDRLSTEPTQVIKDIKDVV